METKAVIEQKKQLLKDLKAWMLVKDNSLEFGLGCPESEREKMNMLSYEWQLEFDDLYEVANNLLRIAGTFVNYKYAKVVSFADIIVIEFCLKNMDHARYELLQYMNKFGKYIEEEENFKDKDLLCEIWPCISGQIRSMVADMTILASIFRTRYKDVLAA